MRKGAIILAAGLSTRMGKFKPLMSLNGKPILLNEVNDFLDAGVEQIVIVTGHNRDQVTACIDGSSQYRPFVTLCYNSLYREDMFTSVQAGVKALMNGLESFFLLPADCPGVSPATLISLMEAFKDNVTVVYPTANGRRGHPPLLSTALIQPILNYSGKDGLRGFLRDIPGSISLCLDDEAILRDMDTPAEYLEILNQL